MALSNQIRAYLRSNGPTTVNTLAEDLVPHLKRGPAVVRNVLHRMPDVYICAWVASRGKPGGPSSVWAVADIPKNAPKPTTK